LMSLLCRFRFAMPGYPQSYGTGVSLKLNARLLQ
jgi:hypothetical protein